MINVAITLAYDGTSYFGWQKTSSGPSIESTLIVVLEKILQQKIILHAASRTDRGVHAEGQVVSCLIPKNMNLDRLAFSANRLLPPSIRIYRIEEKSLDFHASCSVIKKCYRYKIYHHPLCPPFLYGRYWHLYKNLSLTKMREAASYLLGTHDFSSFSNRQENPEPNKICTLFSITIHEESKESCVIDVVGNRFLYKMVRNIIGLLACTGQNKLAPPELPAILFAKKRALAPLCSPAHGLTLQKVWYDWTE